MQTHGNERRLAERIGVRLWRYVQWGQKWVICGRMLTLAAQQMRGCCSHVFPGAASSEGAHFFPGGYTYKQYRLLHPVPCSVWTRWRPVGHISVQCWSLQRLVSDSVNPVSGPCIPDLPSCWYLNIEDAEAYSPTPAACAWTQIHICTPYSTLTLRALWILQYLKVRYSFCPVADHRPWSLLFTLQCPYMHRCAWYVLWISQ